MKKLFRVLDLICDVGAVLAALYFLFQFTKILF